MSPNCRQMSPTEEEGTVKKQRTKINLTDRKLASKMEPGDWMDSNLRGFGVRVSPEGTKTFRICVRPPGKTSASRRTICQYTPLGPAEQRAAESQYNALPEAERGALPLEAWLLEQRGACTLAAARYKARQWLTLI